MFIKKIELENVFAFENKIVLDLKQNKKNLDNDLKAGFLIEKNDQILTPTIAIAGKNASGKTSFLKAIFEMFFFFKDDTNKFMLLSDIYKARFLQKRDDLNIQFSLSETAFSKLNKQFLNYYFKLLFGVENTFEKKEIENSFVFLKKDFQNEVSENKAVENFFEYVSNYFKERFLSIKNRTDKNSKISIYFYDENYGNFQINYFDILVNKSFNDFYFEIIFQDKEKKITKNLLRDIIDYSNNIVFLNSHNDELSTKSEKTVEESLCFLVENFKKSDVIKIINVCDTSIDDFLYIKDDKDLEKDLEIDQLFKYFINKKGQEISIKKLSLGTKKFIIFFSSLSKSLKKSKSSMFLIDEIDSCFHNEIVNFIKCFVRMTNKQKDVQLFYTSYNPLTLTSHISSKQIFYLQTTEKDIKFSKLSTQVNKNNSVLKLLIEGKVGEHPSDDFLREASIDLYLDNF